MNPFSISPEEKLQKTWDLFCLQMQEITGKRKIPGAGKVIYLKIKDIPNFSIFRCYHKWFKIQRMSHMDMTAEIRGPKDEVWAQWFDLNAHAEKKVAVLILSINQ